MQSHRSPRTPMSRSRTKPYARRPPVARSASIMATIKNIVTAPLSWFAANEEFEDTPGKRRRARDGDVRANKKQRIASPEPGPQTNQGYLDPPQLLFQPPTKQNPPAAFSPSVSVNIPTNNQTQPLGRHAYASVPPTTYSQHDLPRTMSMDPPTSQHLTRDATMIPLPKSREHSMASVSRDHSMGPSAPFKMRTTLSPLPSGQEFGPKPQRRPRDPSEPPPLTALMSNPIFVKPPPDAHPMQRSLSAQPTVTLGSLAQRTRPARSPLRHSSGLFKAPGSSDDTSFRPVNASEIALSELAVYRTPLLPSRLRGSTAIPEMFKPKKVHQFVPMRKGKDDLPRLGTKEKKKARKDDGGKPYSGEGGMKKLLARRKLEAEAEKKVETSEAMVDDSDSAKPELNKAEEVPAVIPESPIQQHRVNGRETSSLRVGRTRISRQHQERPAAARPSKNKFSAIYEEEDSIDQMDQGADAEEAPIRPAPLFEAPKGFSFAKEVAPVSIPTETAKEPPIPALPFSLTKAAPVQQPVAVPVSIPATPAPPKPAPSTTSIWPTTPAAPLPAIALIPPTPQTVLKSSEGSPAPAIPNFFANLPRLAQPISAPSTPPTTNLFGIPDKKVDKKPPSIPTLNLTPAALSEDKQSNPFYSLSKPSTQDSLFGGAPPKPTAAAPTSVFGGTENKSLFGSAPAQPSTSNGGSLPFSFGPPKPEAKDSDTPVPPAQPAQHNLFGVTSSAPFGGFEMGANSEASKPPALFGQPAAAVPTAPVVEAPKPVFGFPASTEPKDPPKSTPFTFGSSSGHSSPSKPKFDSTPSSSTPPAEKQLSPLLFGGSSAPPPTMFTFGSSASNAPVDSSKSAFGAATPRPATPPKQDQEERMEESPERSMDTVERPPVSELFASRGLNFGQNGGSSSGPFSFGSSTASNVFGSKQEEKVEPKPTSSGFGFGAGGGGFPSFGQKAPEPTSQPGFGASAPFAFGKSDSTSSQNASTSPFGFNTQKLPEGGGSQASSPFMFGAQKLPDTSQNGSTSSPFGFGTQKLPENNTQANSSPFAFGTQKLPEINTNTGQSFSFGQKPPGSSQGTGSFGYDQKAPGSSQGTGFGFGSQPTSATAGPGFAFGSNQSNPSNAFGQQNPSAPSSPSTFNQPSPFGFGGSTPVAPSSGFGFTPSSPATNSGGFPFGQSAAPQSPAPGSPFSAPTSPQTNAGGALFTIGAAPTNAASGGPRQMKKLPTRRGGKR